MNHAQQILPSVTFVPCQPPGLTRPSKPGYLYPPLHQLLGNMVLAVLGQGMVLAVLGQGMVLAVLGKGIVLAVLGQGCQVALDKSSRKACPELREGPVLSPLLAG